MAPTFVQGDRVQVAGQLLRAQAREAPRNLDHWEDEVDDRADVQQVVSALVLNQLLERAKKSVDVMEREGGKRGECTLNTRNKTRHTRVFLSSGRH